MSEELPYQISLTRIDGVGDVAAKNLVSYCGGAEAVFKEKRALLEKIPLIGAKTAKNISKFDDFETVNKEIEVLNKHKIEALFYLDSKYPFRLKNYEDSPIMLYFKGNANLNHKRIISIVGTRNATAYGKAFTEQLCEALKPYEVLVVSGLAQGTDTNAHKYALKNQLQTVGVLAHGLHTIFPSGNRNLAVDMLSNGGLLTEYAYNTPGMKENFPKRNRIVAGICDALIVVESGIKGGSLITAEIANSYNKDVYCLPGRMSDTWSKGCNKLILDSKAGIIESIDSLLFTLGFLDNKKEKKQAQLSLYNDLTEIEKSILDYIKTGEKSIDDLYFETKISMSKLALILLDLEFKNLVLSLPGKKYAIA